MTAASGDGPRGLTLCINAAENLLQTVFINEHGAVVHACEKEAASQGAEKLAPMLASAFAALGASPAALARVACVRGPGSFTGLRLATTTASGLARATGALQAGIAYLPLLALEYAETLRNTLSPSLLLILTHARRGLVYAQVFTHNGLPSVSPVAELAVLSLTERDEAEEFIQRVMQKHATAKLFLAGSGVAANREIVTPLAQRIAPDTAFIETTHPSPKTLALAACEAHGAAYAVEDIIPLYVRPSDAESNLPTLAQRLGINPHEAVRKLQILTSASPE